MYCSSCGAWNPDDSKFCGKCGRRVQAAAGTPSPESGPDSASRLNADSAQPGRGGRCLFMFLGGLLVVLGILAVGAFILRNQLRDIWPGSSVQPTELTASPTPPATGTPVASTATPVPSASPTPPPAPTATLVPTPAQSPTPSPPPTPRQRAFKAVYKGCIPHAQSLGSVKGQVLDKKGNPIPGAKVRITIDGYDWKSDANPATSNADGWFEWILQVDQKVQFVELMVGGQSATFTPADLEVKAQGGCFQRVDFMEQ